MELSRNPQSNSALSSLDEIRGVLDRFGQLYGRVLLETELELEEATARIEHQVNEIIDLKATDTRREAEQQGTLRLYEQARRAGEEALNAANAEYQALAAQLGAAEQGRDAAVERHDRLTADVAADRAAQRDEREGLLARLSDAHAAVDRRRAEI